MQGRWWVVRRSMALALTVGFAASIAVVGSGSAGANTPAAKAPANVFTAAARTGHVGAGHRVNAPTSSTPFAPTQAQQAARTRALAGLATHLAPSLGKHTTEADVNVSGGPQTTATTGQGPTTFTILRNSHVNSTCASSCAQSDVNEPEVANDGKYVLETSNWNIAYSTTGGRTWLSQNPYALSSGFCCDQQVTYDPGRNIFLLLQLDYTSEGAATNGLSLSISSGKTPTSWCTYTFPGAIGGGSTDTPDYPKIQLANNNAYMTWNDYPPNAGFADSGLARLPLDSLASCSGVSYSYITRSTEFTFALSNAPSSLDTFYWVSNWFLDGTTSGSNMRIFYWAEDSGSYNWSTVAINAYPFGTAACGTTNWCSRLDPRYESVVITRAEYRAHANSAFAGDSILEVATDAGPSSFSNGFNYVVYNYFKLNSLAYIGNDQTYSTSATFAYPGCAVNVDGHVGCAMAEGVNDPGGFILLQDDISPTQPWAYSYPEAGQGTASEWGDYVVTNAWNPAVGPFETILWRVNSHGAITPYYVVWGRGRDTAGWDRWASS